MRSMLEYDDKSNDLKKRLKSETSKLFKCSCGVVKYKTEMVYENDVLICPKCALKKAKQRIRF